MLIIEYHEKVDIVQEILHSLTIKQLLACKQMNVQLLLDIEIENRDPILSAELKAQKKAHAALVAKRYHYSLGNYEQYAACSVCGFKQSGPGSWDKGHKHQDETGHKVGLSYKSDIELLEEV